MLLAEGLSKRYGETVALDGCSVAVERGRLVGFLGPNGAGKTTAMRAVFGLVRLDAGRVSWDGAPVGRAERVRFGYMPEDAACTRRCGCASSCPTCPPARCVRPRRTRARPLARLLGVATVPMPPRGAVAREPAARAAGRCARPRPGRARARRAVLRPRPARGGCGERVLARVAAPAPVLFSSHQLDLVQRMCDEVVIVAQGRDVLSGTLTDLRSASRQRRVEVGLAGGVHWPVQEALPGAVVVASGPGHVRLLVPHDTDPEQVLTAARAVGQVESFNLRAPHPVGAVRRGGAVVTAHVLGRVAAVRVVMGREVRERAAPGRCAGGRWCWCCCRPGWPCSRGSCRTRTGTAWTVAVAGTAPAGLAPAVAALAEVEQVTITWQSTDLDPDVAVRDDDVDAVLVDATTLVVEDEPPDRLAGLLSAAVAQATLAEDLGALGVTPEQAAGLVGPAALQVRSVDGGEDREARQTVAFLGHRRADAAIATYGGWGPEQRPGGEGQPDRRAHRLGRAPLRAARGEGDRRRAGRTRPAAHGRRRRRGRRVRGRHACPTCRASPPRRWPRPWAGSSSASPSTPWGTRRPGR